jgi:hypothetical protein
LKAVVSLSESGLLSPTLLTACYKADFPEDVILSASERICLVATRRVALCYIEVKKQILRHYIPQDDITA